MARKGARGKRRHQERGKVQVINTAKWVWKMGVAIDIETRVFFQLQLAMLPLLPPNNLVMSSLSTRKHSSSQTARMTSCGKICWLPPNPWAL